MTLLGFVAASAVIVVGLGQTKVPISAYWLIGIPIVIASCLTWINNGRVLRMISLRLRTIEEGINSRASIVYQTTNLPPLLSWEIELRKARENKQRWAFWNNWM